MTLVSKNRDSFQKTRLIRKIETRFKKRDSFAKVRLVSKNVTRQILLVSILVFKNVTRFKNDSFEKTRLVWKWYLCEKLTLLKKMRLVGNNTHLKKNYGGPWVHGTTKYGCFVRYLVVPWHPWATVKNRPVSDRSGCYCYCNDTLLCIALLRSSPKNKINNKKTKQK